MEEQNFQQDVLLHHHTGARVVSARSAHRRNVPQAPPSLPPPPPAFVFRAGAPATSSTIGSIQSEVGNPRAEELPRVSPAGWRNVERPPGPRRPNPNVNVLVTDRDLANHLGRNTRSVIGRELYDEEGMESEDIGVPRPTGLSTEEENEILGETTRDTWETNLPVYRADIGEESASFCTTELIWHLLFGIICFSAIVFLIIFFAVIVNY